MAASAIDGLVVLSAFAAIWLGACGGCLRAWRTERGLWMLSGFLLAITLALYGPLQYSAWGDLLRKRRDPAWVALDGSVATGLLFIQARLLVTVTIRNRRFSTPERDRTGRLRMIEIADLDRAMDDLRRSGSTAARRRALRALVEYWHGPIGPPDGVPPGELAGLPLPEALRWWYSWAGRRAEIARGGDRLLRPEELCPVDNGRLVAFWVENQGVYTRATEPAGEDPPVYRGDGRWTPEGMTVLGFLMQVCVQEARGGCWGLVDVDQPALDRFAAAVPRLPVPPWDEPGDEGDTAGRVDFHVGGGVLAQTIDLGRSASGVRGYTLSVAARRAEDLRIVDAILAGADWDERNF